MYKNNSIKVKFFSILALVFFIFITSIAYYEYDQITKNFIKEHKIKNNFIKKNGYNFLESLKSDISKKSDFIANDQKIMKAFYEKDRTKLYSIIKNNYKKQTILNPYIKIMTFRLIDGSTFLRVHKPEMYGDKLNQKRKIIIDTNLKKERHYGFEIGKLKMTYRVVTPLFYGNKHIGLMEIGIEPEFLIDKLEATYDIEHALLVNKENLSVNITKNTNIKFIDDYALIRGSKLFYENIDKIDLDIKRLSFLEYNDNSYKLETNFNLYDHKNNIAAKLLFAVKVTDFKYRNNELLTNIVLLILLMIIMFIIVNYILNKFLSIQEEQLKIISRQITETNIIFNGASNMLILSNGQYIEKVNEAFFRFFDQFSSVEDFKKQYNCICDKFEKRDEENYIYGNTINGKIWTKYILDNPQKIHKAVINKNHIPHHFIIQVKEIKFDNNILNVIELSDITKEINQNEELKRQNKLITNQTKMAALGEMIANIAHQWRQPLTVISSSASSMQVQKDMGILNDEVVSENLEIIMRNSNFLSQTIDDFRDFIKTDKKRYTFNLNATILKSVNILNASLKNNHIKEVLDIKDENIVLNSFENELVQALNNIINNAKDALKEIDIDHKYIFITCYKNSNSAVINIKDNAGGIQEDVIEKIFEPYFTTKHQTQGTGLGLYMTHKIIHESLEGSIKAQNIEYKYHGQQYKGASFTITIPLN